MKKKEVRKGRTKDKDAGAFNEAESKKAFDAAEGKLRSGAKGEAYKLYQQAVALNPEHHRALSRMAELDIEAKNFTIAHQHLETAITYAPECARYYYLKGKAFYNSGQW